MKTRIKVGGGVIIFAVFLLLGGHRYIDIQVVFPWLSAAVTHELGHFAAARLCGAEIEKMTFDVVGARMSLSGKLLSYGEEIFIAAAGPAVNFALAGLLFPVFSDFADFSIMLGILNLIPAPSFDGYRILCSVLSKYTDTVKGESVMTILSFFALFLLWLIAVYALLRYRASFSLFIISCALFARFLCK